MRRYYCRRKQPWHLVVAWTALSATTIPAATLEVGPGKPFARIEDANDAARPGDTVLVYARARNEPYRQVAVFVRRENLAFRAATDIGERPVKISGKGFDYSGRGSTPRAIFQFNRGTDGCVLEGFELTGAHNDSHNGAGVRVNQANHVLIRNCHIHHNDMGIMSNGDGTPATGANLQIEHCIIDHNGDFGHPGYNHNLYLGGTSVALSFCEIHSSLTGQNIKSRAHQTWVQYCYVHDSANREFDLVDSVDTEQSGSDAVIMGCIVAKNPQTKGNRAVLHFGQDGHRDHRGTVYLLFNTIVTPFISPVVELSAPGARTQLTGNLICDGGSRQTNQRLLGVRNGASIKNALGNDNWFSGGFAPLPEAGLDSRRNVFQRIDGPLFRDPSKHDFRPSAQMAAKLQSGMVLSDMALPAFPGAPRSTHDRPLQWEYHHPAGKEKRVPQSPLTIGAYAVERRTRGHGDTETRGKDGSGTAARWIPRASPLVSD